MEKLRKALEKAKQERLQEQPQDRQQDRMDEKETTTGQSAITTTPDASSRKAAPHPDATEALIGQLSPVYGRSRSHELDQGTLADNNCLCLSSNTLEIEAYKMLRTQVMQRTDPNGWNTIMITSALPGEGKTLTAVNLAITFAKEFNHTSLLVDCDLRKQSVHKVLGIDSELGLIDALLDNRPLKDLIVWPGIEKLTLISGGRTISNSSEVLSSMKMKALVNETKFRYPDRYVFFDLPPVLSVTDAVAFAPFVDAILLVVQAEKTSIHDIKKATALLPKEKFLGFVLNRSKVPPDAYPKTYYAKAG